MLPTQRSASVTRLLSQACFSIASDGDVTALSEQALRWATVARQILQRGTRPAIAARAEEIIRASIGDVPAARASQVEAAIGWSDQGWRLADEYQHHANPCEAWGRKARLGDQTWEAPVLAQVAGIALDDVTMASVVAALGSNQQPVEIDRARIDRQIRELALEHAGGGLGDDTYLSRLKVLREQRDAIVERTAPGLPGHRAVEWLRALGESLQAADVGKEKAELMHAIYERITVAGPEIVGVRLTAAAYAHGLALALP